MIPYETRRAVVELREKGAAIRTISRVLKISRNTVRAVLKQPDLAQEPQPQRWQPIISQLPALLSECRGNAVRVQELLQERHQIAIPYSTLTRVLREQQLRAPKPRSGVYAFGPGEEAQHDTSAHRVVIGNQPVTAQCASLVLAYSRLLFFQYFPAFTRFEAKAFLSEAFRFTDGVCARCVIDNTSVLVAAGSGANAVMAPQIEAFAEYFGTTFVAHALGHCDRKGRIEKPFFYIERNFLPARRFRDWDDLNRQARDWCRHSAAAKPKRVLAMRCPAEVYLLEKPYLKPLPAYIPPVYEIHYRVVDTQGYIHLDTNRYSVPERLVAKPVEVHKYLEKILVFFEHRPVAEHRRRIGQKYAVSLVRAHHPTPRRRHGAGPSPQEQALLGRHRVLDAYVAALKHRAPGRGVAKLRQLLDLKRTYPEAAFLAAIEQALRYALFDLRRLERLILQYVAGEFFDLH
jgi:transposase